MRLWLIIVVGALILFSASILYAEDCGDVNASGTLNILDVSYLINYLYKSGPAPSCLGTITDIDGNVYRTVTIGTQIWLAENLKVTHYRNGDDIPNVTDGTTWWGLTTGAYCEYNNDINYVATYGRIYNWFAVADSRNVAPIGWHVATDDEWKQLEMFLGMSQAEADMHSDRGTDEGGKLKDTGTTYWNTPNIGATNSSGFTALPGGYGHANMGNGGYFWTSTEFDSGTAWARALDYGHSKVNRENSTKPWGLSVRCVKD